MKWILTPLCTVVFLAASVFAQDEVAEAPPVASEFPRVDATNKEALREHLGKKATVFGLIKSTKDWDGGANFLNFDGREFMLVCFESEYANFPDGKPATLFKGKQVEVTGYINEYKEQLQIKLTHPGQIKIIEPPKEEEKDPAGNEGDKKNKKDGKGKEKVKEKAKPKKVDPKKYFCD